MYLKYNDKSLFDNVETRKTDVFYTHLFIKTIQMILTKINKKKV